MASIHIVLGMTKQQYQDSYLESFMQWCMSWSTSPYGEPEDQLHRMQREVMETSNDLQKLLANSAISKWYKMEHDIREQNFLTDYFSLIKRQMTAPNFIAPTSEEITKMYNEYILDITAFPRPLIEAARTLRIINDTAAN